MTQADTITPGEITPSRYIAITNPHRDAISVRVGFLVFLRDVERAIGREIQPNTADASRIVDCFFDGLSTYEAALFIGGHR